MNLICLLHTIFSRKGPSKSAIVVSIIFFRRISSDRLAGLLSSVLDSRD